jgi:hypothetical protein
LYLSSRDVRRKWGEVKYDAVIQREWVICSCDWSIKNSRKTSWISFIEINSNIENCTETNRTWREIEKRLSRNNDEYSSSTVLRWWFDWCYWTAKRYLPETSQRCTCTFKQLPDMNLCEQRMNKEEWSIRKRTDE